MRIYYTGVDNGDGTLGVEFFDAKETIEMLEEHDFERYRGEGGFYFDCDTFSGRVTTYEDAKHYLIDMGLAEDFI